MDEKTIAIFVATHVKFNPPKNPIYVPLQVGREGKEDLGYLSDNIGNNISDLNYLFGELTGLFWIWQNIKDIDYVGLCHYRRYFVNENRRPMQREEYLSILSEYDVILAKSMVAGGSYYEHYGKSHDAKYLDVVGSAIKNIYPSYYVAYEKAMKESRFYSGNLVVTSLPILKDYSEWLFTIFMEIIDQVDVQNYDDYHKRIYGFLSEQMFYVYAMTNHLKLYECPIGITDEKAETRVIINQLNQRIQRNAYEEAESYFYEVLKKRPDILLPGSDINGELVEICKRMREKGYWVEL